jgi:YD repeat-containing protein
VSRSSVRRQLAIASVSLALAGTAAAASVIFSYDEVGRVSTAWYDNNMCVAYLYDASGNRTSQTNATPGTPAWGSGAWGCFNWTP